MTSRIGFTRSARPAGRLARSAGFVLAVAAMLGAAQPALAADADDTALAGAASAQTLLAPQWLTPQNSAAVTTLIDLIETSDLDGLKPGKFKPGKIKDALRDVERGKPDAYVKASQLLNGALVRYVTALRADTRGDWEVVDPVLSSSAPSPSRILAEAAAAPSLPDYIAQMQFMQEGYAPLRAALKAAYERDDRRSADVLRLNLQRLRFLPATGKYVLVNAAAQRLYMYDRGRIVDSMKVVVGKPEQPTPMMAALIRFANLNPYWNLPPDLVAERVAPNVLKDGLPYLRAKGYVILSDYGERAKVIDPSTVDWQAVQAGRVELRMRQDPGPLNAMGRMKFMFPNRHGVYLHDTPNKELLGEDARLFSAGCVRLEDAARLGRWLYGRPLRWQGAKAEAKVDLKQPVPVYLAYLTAMPDKGQVAFYSDIYGRDQQKLARKGRGLFAAR